MKLQPIVNDTFRLDLLSVNNYFPFGMQEPERHWSSGTYRYGYNGMEKDNEIKGDGNSYTTHFRNNDDRLGE